MITKLKSNKIVAFLLVFVCIIFIVNPAVYSKSCLNAISVWAVSVLPTLLPFFIITRIIVGLTPPKPNKIDKLFNKLYNTPAMTSIVYVLSVISGYPMGAKLICNLYDSNYISKQDAKRMLAFCSLSGPMFIVGTVGVSILTSYKAGLIILIANIIASLINGLIYRGKKQPLIEPKKINYQSNSNLLQNSVYDALISILMVGAYIVLSFLIIDVLKNLNIFVYISNAICYVFKNLNIDAVQAVLSGIIEITRGTIDLQATSISLTAKTIISSGVIAFGGISVMMQSSSFLTKLQIKTKFMFLQKLTQSLICLIVATPLALIFL